MWSRDHLNKTLILVQVLNKLSLVKGAYEMMHIEKKSMKTSDYKKKAEKLDNITDGLSHEKIEQMVSYPFYLGKLIFAVFLLTEP